MAAFLRCSDDCLVEAANCPCTGSFVLKDRQASEMAALKGGWRLYA